jgi:hypothetical protein
MKEPAWYKMIYDPDYSGWMVHMQEKKYGLHCGECMELRVGDRGVPFRLELEGDWYVIMNGASFTLRKKQIYQIRYV